MVRSGRLKADRWTAVAFSSPHAALSAFSGPWGGRPELGPPAPLCSSQSFLIRLLPEYPAGRGTNRKSTKPGISPEDTVRLKLPLSRPWAVGPGPEACRRRRWRPPSSGSPSSHGLGQEPGVEVGPDTDDTRGSEAGGDAAAPAAQPPGVGHAAAREPDLRLQLLLWPLEAVIVRAHQAPPGPVKVTQELGQHPGLVGAARH